MSQQISPALAALLRGMSPTECVELQQTVDYLVEKSGSGRIAEGSLTAVINGISNPLVKDAVNVLYRLDSNPRDRPFQPKLTLENYLDQMGLDAEQGRAVANRLDSEYVADQLGQRMGIDSPVDINSEPTRRETISAAMSLYDDNPDDS